MGLEIPLVFWEIVLLASKRPDVGIEIPSNYDLQFPLELLVDFQEMSHEGHELAVFLGLAGAEVQRHHEELIGEADGRRGVEVVEPFSAEEKGWLELWTLCEFFVLFLHEAVQVVESMKASAVGVDKNVTVRSSSKLLDNGDISLIFYLIDQLIRAILQKHHIILGIKLPNVREFDVGLQVRFFMVFFLELLVLHQCVLSPCSRLLGVISISIVNGHVGICTVSWSLLLEHLLIAVLHEGFVHEKVKDLANSLLLLDG